MNISPTTYTALGDVISTNAEDVWRGISSKLESLKPSGVLELDLRAALMVDSVGLNVIVRTIKQTSQEGGTVRIIVGNKSVKKIFLFTRLNERAEIVGP